MKRISLVIITIVVLFGANGIAIAKDTTPLAELSFAALAAIAAPAIAPTPVVILLAIFRFSKLVEPHFGHFMANLLTLPNSRLKPERFAPSALRQFTEQLRGREAISA